MPTISAPGDDTTRLASVGDLDATEVISDARPGYLAQVTPQQRTLWASITEQRERNAEALRSVTPAGRAAAARQREAAAEERRRSRGDARLNLVQAHSALAEAVAAVARLEAAIGKARVLCDEMASRQATLENRLRATADARPAAGRKIVVRRRGSGFAAH